MCSFFSFSFFFACFFFLSFFLFYLLSFFSFFLHKAMTYAQKNIQAWHFALHPCLFCKRIEILHRALLTLADNDFFYLFISAHLPPPALFHFLYLLHLSPSFYLFLHSSSHVYFQNHSASMTEVTWLRGQHRVTFASPQHFQTQWRGRMPRGSECLTKTHS